MILQGKLADVAADMLEIRGQMVEDVSTLYSRMEKLGINRPEKLA